MYIFNNSIARNDHPFKACGCATLGGRLRAGAYGKPATPCGEQQCHKLTFVRNLGFARCALPKYQHDN